MNTERETHDWQKVSPPQTLMHRRGRDYDAWVEEQTQHLVLEEYARTEGRGIFTAVVRLKEAPGNPCDQYPITRPGFDTASAAQAHIDAYIKEKGLE